MLGNAATVAQHELDPARQYEQCPTRRVDDSIEGVLLAHAMGQGIKFWARSNSSRDAFDLVAGKLRREVVLGLAYVVSRYSASIFWFCRGTVPAKLVPDVFRRAHVARVQDT